MSRANVGHTVCAALVSAIFLLVSACSGSGEAQANKVTSTSAADDPSDLVVPGVDDEDGASSSLHFEGVATNPGTTEITIEYFYRGEKSSKRPDMHLAVEVVSP